MDAHTRNFISALLVDNERLERLAGLGFGIAACMQQLADTAGQGFGVAPLTPGLPLPAIEQIAHDLAARLEAPAAPERNGQRVLVGTSKEAPHGT